MGEDPSTLLPSGVTSRGSTSEGERVPGLLRLFSGERVMAQAMLLHGEALELGRGAVLGEVQDPRMSRRHARVQFDGQHFQVTDLGSQNGTFVDGEQVPAGTPREARRVIRMGDSLFVPCADVAPLEKHGVTLVEGFVRGPALQRLLAEVARAAKLGFTLYIHGESGAGKEGVAKTFHQHGPQSAGPFVAVNCAAIPRASPSGSCSAPSAAPTQGPTTRRATCRRPMAARSSSTRWWSSIWRSRPSCCERSRRARRFPCSFRAPWSRSLPGWGRMSRW